MSVSVCQVCGSQDVVQRVSVVISDGVTRTRGSIFDVVDWFDTDVRLTSTSGLVGRFSPPRPCPEALSGLLMVTGSGAAIFLQLTTGVTWWMAGRALSRSALRCCDPSFRGEAGARTSFRQWLLLPSWTMWPWSPDKKICGSPQEYSRSFRSPDYVRPLRLTGRVQGRASTTAYDNYSVKPPAEAATLWL